MRSKLLIFALAISIILASCVQDKQALLFYDDFKGLARGPLSTRLGAFTEYHYLPEAGRKGQWAVSNDRGWWSAREVNGERFLYQSKTDEAIYTHPMIVAGDECWQDFTLSVTFKPESTAHQSGIVFHYQNDRCYYFFGVDGNKTVLKMVKHGSGFHQPFERILSQTEYQWQPGEPMQAIVKVTGSRIHARLGDGLVLEADDSTYQKGKIGLTANSPTKFMGVKVTTSEADKKTYEAARAEFEKQ